MTQRVVVITGASAGVGRATARAFAKRGAAIALLARGQDGLEAAAREVEQLGGRSLVIPIDVAEARHVEQAAQQLAGDAIVWASEHRRREVHLGWPSVRADLGQQVLAMARRTTCSSPCPALTALTAFSTSRPPTALCSGG